jgi:membrane protein implicated in regulation of membrane protease activity
MRAELIVWGCIALGLVAAEVIAPGVFMLWLGFAAAGVFALLVLFPKLTMLWQAIAWVVFSLALIPAYRHFLSKNDHVTDQPLLNKKGAQLVGQRHALESAIVAGRGRVKIGDAFWQVRGPDMPAGTRIIITGVDSMILFVEQDRD